MAGLDADEYALDELTCPITGEIRLDPVLCVGDGHTYERLAAERWLATHATSPLTGQPLEQPEGLTLVENHSVRKQAAALVQRRPELRPTAPRAAPRGPRRRLRAARAGPHRPRRFGGSDEEKRNRAS